MKTNEISKVTCHCPGITPGVIKTDLSSHEDGCWIRKRLLKGKFTTNTSVLPRSCNDGFSLGVAIT